MNALRLFSQLIRADFLERFRRYSTLITIGLILYLTYIYLPSNAAGYVTFNMNGFRGIYNSAWVGSIVTVLTVIFMSLPGFYLVKNAVERDRQTGVGQILATTPLTKWQYLLGKMLSNLCFLMAMAGVALIGALGMQLLRGEDVRVDLWAYLAPYLLVTLPFMALVAGLAVFFEAVRFLRGGAGNVIFFFLYVGALTLLGLSAIPALKSAQAAAQAHFIEPTGTLVLFQNMIAAGFAQNPAFTGGLVLGSTPVSSIGQVHLLTWQGVDWNLGLVTPRLAWLAAGLGLAFLAAIPFDRFDQTALPARRKRGKSQPAQPPALDEAIAAVSALPGDGWAAGLTAAALAPAHPSRPGSVFLRLLLAELRLAFKGVALWWYLAAAGLLVGQLLAPLEQARGIWLALAWAWPLLLWSQLGTRENRWNTRALLYATASYRVQQFFAIWLAGVVLAVIAGLGAALRLAVAGDWGGLLGWAVCTLLIPSLALALGSWSGSSKPFEVIYLICWYLGPINHVPGLDFIALNSDTPILVVYLVAGIVLCGMALLGRTSARSLA